MLKKMLYMWCRPVAEQGYASAQNNLGKMWGKRKTTFPYIKCA
jgi:hypothetical protein